MRFDYARQHGYQITFYCQGYTTRKDCGIGWKGSWDQLIQYFGLEADITDVRPRLLRAVECSACGRCADTLTLRPPEKSPGTSMASWDWQRDLDQPPSPAEQRRDEEREAHDRLLAQYAEAQRAKDKAIFEYYDNQRREQKRLQEARDKGIFLIGPPSPHRFKKNRPAMKG